MKTYSFIYFDLDDTLLDHKRAERDSLQSVHQEFEFLQSIDFQRLREQYHRVNSGLWLQYGKGEVDRYDIQRRRFEETLAHFGLDSTRWEEVGDVYMSKYRFHWHWIEGTRTVFERIARVYPTGIMTNGFAETQRKKFEAFGLYDLCREFVISEEVGSIKPQPKVFEHATEAAGVSADQILYVGDSFSSDVMGGRNFGWDVAWFTKETDPEKRNKAIFCFDDFKQLESFLFPDA